METLFIYFLKSSGLLVAFYLAYYFLLKKETFFNSNRWYLLIGLVTSALLPLVTFEKIKLIETNNDNSIPTLSSSSQSVGDLTITNEVVINWYSIGFWVYIGIATVLLLKISFELFQVFKTLKNKPITKQANFNYVDIDEVVAPFSFFKYIVFNSKLYSSVELASILEHEKVHSSQVHSLDVLVASVFQVVFWFNPILYLYKKSIIQNLEFIADSKAIAQFEDKKRYQMTLLKVVSYQNCLPITNHFYQSLIKKRIIMLNKNQSKKQNAWKYSVIIPALIAFVLFFQVTVVAQEKFKEIKESDGRTVNAKAKIIEINFDKNSTVKDFEEATSAFKKEQNVDLKFSNFKRNSKGELIEITIKFDNNKGTNGVKEIKSDEPIKPFMFESKTYANGKMKVGFAHDLNEVDTPASPSVPSVPSLKTPPSPPTTPSPPKKGKKQVYISSPKEKEDVRLAIVEAKKAVEASKNDIKKSKIEVEKSRKETERSIKYVEEHKSEIENAEKIIAEHIEEIEQSKKEIAESSKQFAEAKKQIADDRKQLDEKKESKIRDRIRNAYEEDKKLN